MALLVYPLIQGRELGWPWWTFAMEAAGVAAFGLFALLERRRDRAGLPTLVTPSLFGKRAFTGGLLTGMVLFGSMLGMSIVFTLFVQYGLGYSPLRAGLAGVAQAIGMVAGFILAQPLNQRFGRRLMHAGLVITFAGYVGFVLTLDWAGDGVDILAMSPALLLMGLGLGLTMAPFFDLVLAGVDEAESGSASGALTSVQQLGGAFGIAVLGTVFFHVLDGGGAAPTRIGAFRDAAAVSMVVAAGMVALAFVLTFLLPKRAREAA
jgi:Na+/melibiose symporter-like transporter